MTSYETESYLEAEFRRYFPDAASIDIHAGNPEIIEARILGPIDDTQSASWIENFRMEVGSDDDWFSFQSEHGLVITLPFLNEET